MFGEENFDLVRCRHFRGFKREILGLEPVVISYRDAGSVKAVLNEVIAVCLGDFPYIFKSELIGNYGSPSVSPEFYHFYFPLM